MTDVVEKAWNGSTFLPYRATRRGFYPNSTNWVVGLPGYENRYACPSGTCDCGSDDVTSSFWYLYADGSRNTYKTSETNPAGHVTSWLYDYRLSVPTQETDPNSVVTSAEYDKFGRLNKIIRPGDSSASPTVLVGYYDNGVNGTGPFVIDLQQKHSGGAYDLRKFYDGFGQLLQTQLAGAQVNGTAQDVVVDYAYNAYGQVTQQSVPYALSLWNLSGSPYRGQQLSSQAKTVTSYDKAGRVTLVMPPTSTEAVSYHYDQDLTVVMRNARGYDAITVQDVWGRVLESRPPTGPWLRYTYNAADQLRTVEKIDGSNPFATTSMEYDIAGRKLKMIDMDMGTWYYSYDAVGNLTGQTDARGCTTILTYNDGLSRLTGKSYSGSCGVTTLSVAYGYDDITSGNKGKGQRTSMSDGSGSTLWFYGDNRGRLTKETKTISGNGSFVTQWAYDSGDQVTSLTYPDGETVSYSYLPQMAVTMMSGSSTYVQSTHYDAVGRVELRALGSNELRTDYQYQPWNTQGGRLAWLQSGSNAANDNLQRFEYSYDANGNVAWINDYLTGGTQTQSFGYDTLDRLTTASASGGTGGAYSQSYTYDANGRPTTGPLGSGYTYDVTRKHEVALVGSNSFGYDLNGNMTARTENGSSYTQNYDAENRLVGVTGATAAAFRYDGDSQRVQGVTGGAATLYVGAAYEATSDVAWVDDAVPTGALAGGDTDTWNWVGSNPAPLSGNVAHASANVSGMHQHYFYNANQTLTINAGDTLYAYVYLDPANPPQEIILQWYDSANTWEHRAYWGQNLINFGTDGTNSRRYMGALPGTGGWARLEVPAALVGLAGQTINGMAFTLYGGKATWDRAGKDNAWVDDSLPLGATLFGDIDSWSWSNTNPTPVAGSLTHGSANYSGMHQHYFYGATQTLQVNSGDTLYAYVYLDPANPPQEVMLQWDDGTLNWAHRAYWGQDLIAAGTNGTNSRRYIGALPPVGAWVRLEVPAALVGLEGQTVSGMAFTLYGGKATWDRAGKSATKKYYYAGNQRVAMRQGNTVYWLLGDHLGSTAYTINGTTETSETRYYPWGKDRFTSGSTLTSYKFTGQREEASLGLYYYGARWYDPALGRFIQPDTIVPNPRDVQSFDRYAYALNNPLRYADPTGHYSRDELIQHFGCAENDWACVEAVFANDSKDARYRGAGEWLQILLDAVDGDVVTAWNPNSQAVMTGQFLRNAETGAIGIQMVLGDGQLTGPIPESAFAAYGAGKPYVGGYNYALQRSKYVQPSGQHYNPPDLLCEFWDCTAIGLDLAALGGSALMDISLTGEVVTGGASTAGVLVGLTVNRAATVAGLTRTIQGYSTGDSSGADLAVVGVTSSLNAFPVVGTAAGVGQLLWDVFDPFHPW